MVDAQAAMTVVLAVGGYKVLELVIGYFFRKVTGDEFVTKKSCEACAKQGDGAVTKLTGEVATIKGILLVIAVKSDIPPDQLARLTQ